MRSPAWTRDELLLICAHLVGNDWRQLRVYQQATHELAELLRALPLHDPAARDLPEFRSAASVSRKSADLITGRPDYNGPATRGGQLTRLVAEAFVTREDEMLEAARAIESGISSGELVRIPEQPDEIGEDGITAPEGRLLARWAISRERDPRLRRMKIDEPASGEFPFNVRSARFTSSAPTERSAGTISRSTMCSPSTFPAPVRRGWRIWPSCVPTVIACATGAISAHHGAPRMRYGQRLRKPGRQRLRHSRSRY